MAIRLDTIRLNIRHHLRDLDLNNARNSSWTIDSIISSHMQTIIGSLGHASSWGTMKALVAGDGDYDVAATAAEVHTAALFKLETTGTLVEKVSPELFERIKQGSPTASGTPRILCIVEEEAAAGTNRLLNLLLYPIPAVAENLLWLSSSMPVPVSADSDGVPLSHLAARALELNAASEILAAEKDPPIAKDVISLWQARAQNAMHDEEVRVRQMRRGRQMNESTSV